MGMYIGSEVKQLTLINSGADKDGDPFVCIKNCLHTSSGDISIKQAFINPCQTLIKSSG
jgi:hypothetical protein